MPFGYDADVLLPYYTTKYVKVNSWKLGLMQKILMLCIMGKIIGLTLLYRCEHLLPVQVSGSARASAQQPTKDNCDPLDEGCISDFTPLTQLAYCSESPKSINVPFPLDSLDKQELEAAKDARKASAGAEGKAKKPADSEEDGNTKRLLKASPTPVSALKTHCDYLDMPAMQRGRSPVPGTLFIPTFTTEHKEKRGCKPSKENGFTCKTKPWVGTGAPKEDTHVADVERFNVNINQAFSADTPHTFVNTVIEAMTGKQTLLKGRSSEFQGFVKGRPDLADFYTKKNGWIERMEKDEKDHLKVIAKRHAVPDMPDHSGAFRNLYSGRNGDVLSVGDLLRMADLRGEDLLDEVRPDGTSMRQTGGVVQVTIEYSNKQFWDVFGLAKPEYVIKAKFIPMDYYQIVYDVIDQADHDKRTVHQVRGLLFLIDVGGSIHTFSIQHLLMVLTTAMVSLAMATTLTDAYMQYIPPWVRCPCRLNPMNAFYVALKYQDSADFSDVKEIVTNLETSQGKEYQPTTRWESKNSLQAQILGKAVGAKKPPQDQELLKVLASTEVRLNRLDGLDPFGAWNGEIGVYKDPLVNYLKGVHEELKKPVGVE